MTKGGDTILFSKYRDNFFYELSQVKGYKMVLRKILKFSGKSN